MFASSIIVAEVVDLTQPCVLGDSSRYMQQHQSARKYQHASLEFFTLY